MKIFFNKNVSTHQKEHFEEGASPNNDFGFLADQLM